MMKDISEFIHFWISCSNDVWLKWFAKREHAAYDFTEVEELLFKIIVLDKVLHKPQRNTLDEFLELIRVQYIVDVRGSRQFCKVQAAGNIYAKSETLAISRGSTFSVRSIDTMGTMLNSQPYVEVKWRDGFILESPQSLVFLIEQSL